MDAPISFDAGDASPPDAPFDAGADAGLPLPPPVVTAASNLQMEASTFDSTRVAVSPSSLMMIDVLELDVSRTGIDALIGENGIQTLSLSQATVRALADVEMAGRLIGQLDASIMLLPVGSAPDITALRDEAIRLRDSLVSYRDTLITLFRSRLAASPPGVTLPAAYSETLFAEWTNQQMQINAVIERSATSGLATVQGVCPAAVGIAITYRVFDDESGLALITGQTNNGTFTVDVSPSSTRTIRIAIDPNARTVMSEVHCDFTITSQRTVRTAPQQYNNNPTLLNAHGAALAAFVTTQNDTQMARALGADPPVVDAVEHMLSLTWGVLSSVWAATETASTFLALPEDLERALRLFAYVDAMYTALLTSSNLSQAVFNSVRADLTATQTNLRTMVDTLRPLL
jgi:hypothetical protein